MCTGIQIITDDMSAVQMNDILKKGGKVYFSLSKDTSIKEPLIIEKPVEIAGNNITGRLISQGCETFIIRSSYVTIKNMQIVGDKDYSIILDGDESHDNDIQNRHVYNTYIENIVLGLGGIEIRDSNAFFINKVYQAKEYNAAGKGLYIHSVSKDKFKGNLDGVLSNFSMGGAAVEIKGFNDGLKLYNFNIERSNSTKGAVYIHDTSHTSTMYLENVSGCRDASHNGFNFENAANILLNNSYYEDNCVGHGYTMSKCTNITFNNCGVVGSQVGYFCNASKNIIFRDCYSHNNSDVDFYIYAKSGNCSDIKYYNCSAYNTPVDYMLTYSKYGFFFTHENPHKYEGIVLRDCRTTGHGDPEYAFSNPGAVLCDNFRTS